MPEKTKPRVESPSPPDTAALKNKAQAQLSQAIGVDADREIDARSRSPNRGPDQANATRKPEGAPCCGRHFGRGVQAADPYPYGAVMIKCIR
ncbi:Uncharacterized protein PBTT_09005 [Plasmodiophora brassicae]|uniref:Uncharacterized protein n=1 Tax=Plasmodiophora brassicae TaxID=37360 RepID=A0A0G4J142_PLABS|nr:hypothetical protein PBRA_008519 [Plasmodiophora brassicae]